MLGLALSGGAAKGLAHLRIYDILSTQYSLRPDIISGASAGALFGSMLAMGKSPDEIRGIFASAKFQSMVKGRFKYINWKALVPFGAWTPGFFKLNKFRDYLDTEIYKGITFEELPTKFICAYTDLENNKTEYCTKGSVADAVTFSITFPIIFESLNGRFYDGGLKINCPTSILKANGAKYVIASDLTSISNPFYAYNEGILSFINRVFDVLWTETFVDDLNCADVVISPPLDSIKFFDFDKLNEIHNIIDLYMGSRLIRTKLLDLVNIISKDESNEAIK